MAEVDSSSVSSQNKRVIVNAAGAAAAAAMFTASIILGEFLLMQYSPENNRDIFQLMMPSPSLLYLSNGNQSKIHSSNSTRVVKRLLVCTMLTNDFHHYAAGAAKLGQVIEGSNDKQVLWSRHMVHMDLGILEMQVWCVSVCFLSFAF